MTTAPTGGRRRVGAAPATETTARGASPQTRWTAGHGQAAALTAIASTRRAATGTAVSRVSLLRDAIDAGLRRPVRAVRAQGPVDAIPRSQESKERTVIWVPPPGVLDKLDAQAEKVGDTSRNDLIRRHVAAWLDENPEPTA